MWEGMLMIIQMTILCFTIDFQAFLSCFFCFLFTVQTVIINNQSWVSDTHWKSSLCRCSCFRWGLHYSRLTGVSCADGTFKEIVTGKVSESSFLSNSDCEESVLINEDSCFNVPSIPPSGQIYLRLREPRPPYLSQQPVLLAWHLCLCSAVIVDLYFDSMHLRILLMCVFYLCIRAHSWLCVCACVSLCLRVCVHC